MDSDEGKEMEMYEQQRHYASMIAEDHHDT